LDLHVVLGRKTLVQRGKRRLRPDRYVARARLTFMALCGRYDIKPFRYRGQRQTTLMAKASRR
jgi:hypothetical protein